MDTKEKTGNNDNGAKRDFLFLQYQSLSAQQINHDSLIWNTPSLMFVAQAILWELALNESISLVIRCCVSLVSVFIGLISVQSFVRNRLMEIADSEQLYEIEKMMASHNGPDEYISTLIIHHQLDKRTIISDGKTVGLLAQLRTKPIYKRHPLSHIPTFYLWEFAFWLTIAFAIILFTYNLLMLLS